MKGAGTRAYCCAPGVVWARDGDRVLLADPEEGKSWSLSGAEAAVWDRLALGYSYREVVRMLGLLVGTAQEEAVEMLHATLRRWCEMGVVRGPGES